MKLHGLVKISRSHEGTSIHRIRSIKSIGWHFFGVSPLGAFGAFFAVFILLHFSCPSRRHYTTVTQIKNETRHCGLTFLVRYQKTFSFKFGVSNLTLIFRHIWLFVSKIKSIFKVAFMLHSQMSQVMFLAFTCQWR